MKNADTMFKELGYKKTISNKEYLEYSQPYKVISFWKRNKDFETTFAISMQELKAINKKCEELGWLEQIDKKIKEM